MKNVNPTSGSRVSIRSHQKTPHEGRGGHFPIVKKCIPELSKFPQKFIHKPWEMEMKYQQAINTIIGKDYPKPIVIHEEARASALKAFQSLKKN